MADEERVGEDDLIQSAFAPLASSFAGALGLKDDCAFLTPPDGEDLVLTADAVAAGVHFFPQDDPSDIAWKALAVNVSDLIAKGARPLVYLSVLSFPEKPERAWLDGFSRGLAEAQSAFGLQLAGGDTDCRPGPLSVSVTAIGAVPRGRMVRRATGRAGDVLFVSGTIGDSALGLLLRQDQAKREAMALDEAGASFLLGRYLRPAPPLALAPLLPDFATAAMDVSDGLAKDCGRLAHASSVAAEIDIARLPLSEAARTAVERLPALLETVLAGGDDYQVLGAVEADRADDLVAEAAHCGVAVTPIGRLTAGSGLSILGPHGQSFVLRRAGWDHFPG